MTAEKTEEFSLLVNYQNSDKDLNQDILEIALKHLVRPYQHGNSSILFTHPDEKVLKDFQKELISQSFHCEFIFKSPTPLL